MEGAWWTLQPHSAKRILKTNSSCKQDISFCQKDQKRLEVSLLSLSLPCLSLPALSACFSRHQEEMAAGETQIYAKVSNKLKGRSTTSLLDPLLSMGFPAHTA